MPLEPGQRAVACPHRVLLKGHALRITAYQHTSGALRRRSIWQHFSLEYGYIGAIGDVVVVFFAITRGRILGLIQR